ncbi:hypothetical protein INR49_018120 [Caranx melampygus]|nr:hypothetical protein INR49_018120 [Caranx melampygus]
MTTVNSDFATNRFDRESVMVLVQGGSLESGEVADGFVKRGKQKAGPVKRISAGGLNRGAPFMAVYEHPSSKTHIQITSSSPNGSSDTRMMAGSRGEGRAGEWRGGRCSLAYFVMSDVGCTTEVMNGEENVPVPPVPHSPPPPFVFSASQQPIKWQLEEVTWSGSAKGASHRGERAGCGPSCDFHWRVAGGDEHSKRKLSQMSNERRLTNGNMISRDSTDDSMSSITDDRAHRIRCQQLGLGEAAT